MNDEKYIEYFVQKAQSDRDKEFYGMKLYTYTAKENEWM